MSTTFFQIFIIVDVFIAGILAALAVSHGRAHYRPAPHDAEQPQLSAATKERLLRKSETQFQKVLEHSVDDLTHDLESSSDQINELIKRFAGDIVNDEMERYRVELAKLHNQAETDMGGIKKAVAGHQQELEMQLAKEMEIEKQRLVTQIDIKLADAVASFLLEALGHNIDLGSQQDYLVSLLEEHKAEFKAEITHES